MVKVVINSFHCSDEQDSWQSWSGSDAVYFRFADHYSNGNTAYSTTGPIHYNVEAGETVYTSDQAGYLGNRDYMVVQLWESDQFPEVSANDLIGTFTVPESLNGTGQHSITLSSSDAQY